MADARGRRGGSMAHAVWRDLYATRVAALVAAALLALPVTVLTAADLLTRTGHIGQDQLITRQLGHADARVTDLGPHPIAQRPDGRGFHSDAATTAAGTTPAGSTAAAKPRDLRSILGLLPRGARAIGDATARVRVRLGTVTMPLTARELPYDNPVAAGLITQVSGRPPAGRGEVAISSALREQTNATLGDTLVVQDTGASLRVVGVVDDPNDTGSLFALGQPGSLFPADTGADGRPVVHRAWLVSRIGDLDWPAVRELNGKGLLVISRAVLRDPPPAAQAPYCQSSPCDAAGPLGSTRPATGLVVPGTRAPLLVALPVLLLLAGAGFAVALAGCARRAFLADLWAYADGVPPLRGRAALLSAGCVGVAGCVLGLPAGLALALALRAVARPVLLPDAGPIAPHPVGLAAIAAFGVLTALTPVFRRRPARVRVGQRARAHRAPALRGGRLSREDGGHE